MKQTMMESWLKLNAVLDGRSINGARIETLAELLDEVSAALDRVNEVPAEQFTANDFKALAEVRRKAGRIAVAKRPPRNKVIGRPPSEEAMEKGREAYELRLEGMSWEQVAEATGVTQRKGRRLWKITDFANRYAQRNRLPWPVGRRGTTYRSPMWEEIGGGEDDDDE